MTTFSDLKITTSTAPSYKVFKLAKAGLFVIASSESTLGPLTAVEADAKLDELLGNPGHTDCQEWDDDIVFRHFANYDEDSPWAEATKSIDSFPARTPDGDDL